MPIKDFIIKFLRYCSLEEGLSHRTVNAMGSSLKTFLKRTSVINLSDITLDVLREFFYEGQEKHHWSTYNYANYHKYLKRFLNWCVSEKLLKENPVNQIKKPKKARALPRRLSEEEANKILYTSFSYEWHYEFEQPRNYAIISVFLYAGLRLNELLNLEMTDINIQAGNILVRHGKGDKDRNVPIYYKLSRILKAYLKERKRIGNDSRYLFTGVKSGKRLCEKDIWRICKKISIDIGVKFTPHQLRHTFGSVSVEKGLNIVKLSSIMGHGSINSTMIYLKMSSKNLKESLNKLDMF